MDYTGSHRGIRVRVSFVCSVLHTLIVEQKGSLVEQKDLLKKNRMPLMVKECI